MLITSACRSNERQARPKFIIWAPPYDETSGGAIALHTLCDRLNQLGVAAYVWPGSKPSPTQLRRPKGWAGLLLESLKGLIHPFDTGPFPRRTARYRDLQNAIVVYPEIVSGNPLNANAVVRWLLYAPGLHTGTVRFGEDDLFFFYQDKFNDPAINPDSNNLLRVSTIHAAYKRNNFGSRSGSAYIVRKGKNRDLNQHPPDSIRVDALSHEEKAEIFNGVKYFYSYDLYTMYSIYAALCGCISIVIPDSEVSRAEWYREDALRFGLAYGHDDEQWALQTAPALIERLRNDRSAEDEMVRAFVEKCIDHFGDSPVRS